jgi:hypothetical protein
MRRGPWKLRLNQEVELYNLEDDLAESTNLAERYPDRVEAMREAMMAFDEALKASSRPAGSIQ